MPEIIVIKDFKHVVEGDFYPTDFKRDPKEKPISVDQETADIAVREGWALYPGKKRSGPRSPGSGPVKQSQSLPEAKARAKRTRKKSKVKPA